MADIEGEMKICALVKSDGKYNVNIVITLINHGPSIRVLDTNEYPIRINKVETEVIHGFSFKKIAKLRLAEAQEYEDSGPWKFPTNIRIYPNTPKRISIFYELEHEGNYLFSLILSGAELEPKNELDKLELQRAYEIYKGYESYINFVDRDK